MTDGTKLSAIDENVAGTPAEKETPEQAKAKMAEHMAKHGYEIVEGNPDEEVDQEDLTNGFSKYPAIGPKNSKEKGNAAFKAGKYKRAILYYQGGLKEILSALCRGPEALGDMELSDLDLTLNLNVAQCYIKMGEPEMGIQFCDKALRRRGHLRQEQLVKALYRKAMCFGESGVRTEECIETLKDLLDVEPENKAAQQYYNVKKREWDLQKRKDKSRMKEMFGSYEKDREQAEIKLREIKKKKIDKLGFQNLDKNFLYVFSSDAADVFQLPKESASKSPVESKEKLTTEGSISSDKPKEPIASDDKPTDPTTSDDKGAAQDKGSKAKSDEKSESNELGLKVEEKQKAAEDITNSDIVKAVSSSATIVNSRKDDVWKEEVRKMTRGKSPIELAYMCAKIKCLDRKCWSEQLRDTIIYSLMQYTLVAEQPPWDEDIPEELALYFLGASGSFELQFLDPTLFLKVFPKQCKKLRLVCIGFVGEWDKENKVIEDQQKPKKDGVWAEELLDDRTCVIEVYNGLAEKVMQEQLKDQKPNMAFLFQPYFHRYFSRWWPAIQMLVTEMKTPFVVSGGSEPDYSWTQDERILEGMGATIVLNRNKNPYPLSLEAASKCNHIIICKGGKGKSDAGMLSVKIELLAGDVHLIGR